ncbi:MAG: farnesyl diphosphate synthase [Pirellulales bacterium]
MERRAVEFPAMIEPYRHRVDAALESYSQFDADCPAQLAEAIRYSLLAPGKRLRPILVLLACEACGGDAELALPAAVAVEMIHAYSLIHDDLPAMDDDDLRRGRPTCHVVYGEALAILAGDALLARALEVCARYLPATVAGPCCAQLARAAGPSCLVGGQVDDLAAERQPVRDLAQLEAIHLRKTGAMLRVSLGLGAMIAGADPRHLAALDEYGWRLGLAFQIVDDLLDAGGDAARLGKRAGKDSVRGKLTYPALLGIDGSRQRAGELIEEACGWLSGLPGDASALAAGARYILARDH